MRQRVVQWFFLVLLTGRLWAAPPLAVPDPSNGQLLLLKDGAVRALALEDGQELWRTAVDGASEGKLLVVDGQRYLATPDKLYSVARDGEVEQLAEMDWGPQSYSGGLLYGFGGSVFYRGPVPWEAKVAKIQAVLEAPDALVLTTEKELLVLDKEGKLLWKSARAATDQGPWLLKDLVVVGRGQDLLGFALADGQRRWDYRLRGDLVGAPAVKDDLMLASFKVDTQHYVVGMGADGRPRFRVPMEGTVVSMLPGSTHLIFCEGEGGISISALDEAGVATGRWGFAGELVKAVEMDGKVYVFIRTKLSEPKFDLPGAAFTWKLFTPKLKPVYNLKTGEPMQEDIQGYLLLSWVPGQTPDQLASEPRQSLVGPIQVVEDTLLYATQFRPERQAGQRVKTDWRHPYEPVAVHGVHQGQSWTYAPTERRQAPSKDRLPDKAFPVDGTSLLFTTEDDRLAALALASGQPLWETSKMRLDEGSASIVADDQGLTVLTQVGALHYAYRVKAGQVGWHKPLTDVFLWDKFNNLMGVLILCAALCYFIFAARRRDLFIRRIAGLNALDEAVGRATEMGKPVLYVTGLADVDDIQTLASLSILGHVAKKTAEYDTPILVPTSRAVAFSAAQEVVKEAYTAAGRPDAFVADNVRYLTDDQFGYTAGIDGMMLRERPAANFYMGKFYAESLILAETGHATGAIQIAGTAMPSQLPFFVAACDYTLIGEELFAASAYLSKDPLQVGSLRGQDVGKAIVMVCLVLGALAITFGYDFVKGWFAT
ncbi:MAG: DUF6754 domain-containing protein [Vulcanimicrobiota bacterium]